MKRFWIGIALLLALVLTGFLADNRMDRLYEPICRNLEAAADSARKDQWEDAGVFLSQALGRWERTRPLSAALFSQLPLEQADGLFAQLQVCPPGPLFFLLCARLAREVEDLSQAHSICWWNLA